MGQSFLTHDEKSSQSPSPDLLQFSGVSNPKFFGSLSSVKETSTSSSSRSPLELTDSEKNFAVASCSSASSPGSPPQIDASGSYNNLVPSPIQPGNVNRLREKFMELDAAKRRNSTGDDQRNDPTSKNGPPQESEDTFSELDYHLVSRPATTSPYVPLNRGHRRSGTLPSSTRHRNSLHSLSPNSRNAATRNRASLPTSSSAYEKLDVIRSDNNLSESFRQMTLGGSRNGVSFTSETPLVRHRPRARPYVPQPRSVIIKAGYLPVLQTVDVISTRPKTMSVSAGDEVDFPGMEHEAPIKSNECTTTTNNPPTHRIKEEVLLVSSSAAPRKRLGEDPLSPSVVVTNLEDHTSEKKVLMKDAEVNTSAEVLVLPKGTKTSVLLKTEMDGKAGTLTRRRKKRGVTRRVARVIGRLMIRLVELF